MKNYGMKKYWKEFTKNKYLYLLILPGFLIYIIFSYGPMYGLLLAFKDYNASRGILGSEWVGLKHFKSLFGNSYFWKVLWNTIEISFGRILVEFPVPIILALLFNELRCASLKRILQTIFTFPHFLSWVILAGIVTNVLDYYGPINALINFFGEERQTFLGNAGLFKPILYISSIWKEAGWGSIVYLAAIAGINIEFYEAADLDGASRLQKIWYITLPAIRGTILVLLVMKVGTVMHAGFDQIFNMTNPAVQEVSDILDTYIYRITFVNGGSFSYSTAVGMFTSVVNFSLVMVTNWFSRKLEGVGILE